jgi:hypothetical protein
MTHTDMGPPKLPMLSERPCANLTSYDGFSRRRVSNEAARVHQAHWRRYRRLAACCARAAVRQGSPGWYPVSR